MGRGSLFEHTTGPNGEKSMLHLEEVIATLVNVNLRTEKMGKDNHRPAADLSFSVDIPSTMLDTIEPGLLKALYRAKDESGHQGDLAAAPEQLTTPRFPKAKPFALTEDWPGYFLDLAHGEWDNKQVSLDKGTLKSISLAPKNGGTVELSFKVGCHPQPEEVAILYELMGSEVDITLAPPSLDDLKKLREDAKKKVEPPPPVVDPAQQQLGADAPAGRAFSDAIDGRGDRPPSTKAAAAPAAAAKKAPAKKAAAKKTARKD